MNYYETQAAATGRLWVIKFIYAAVTTAKRKVTSHNIQFRDNISWDILTNFVSRVRPRSSDAHNN
jgi:hypothetical protein